MRRPLFWPFIGVIAALLLAACPQPAADPVPFEIVLNTGYDQAAGMTIAYGTPDDSWDLVTWVPASTLSYGSNVSYGCGLGAYSAPVPPPAPNTPADAVVVLEQDWSSRWGSRLAGPDSRWVSVDQRGRPGLAPLEEFVYTYEFTLPQGTSGLTLSMDIYADQEASVSLNGNLIGTVPDWPVQASQGPAAISTADANYFQAGTNVLEVEVTETGAYSLSTGCGIVTGFNLVGTVSGLKPFVPPPPTAMPGPSPISVQATPMRPTATPSPTPFLQAILTPVAVAPQKPSCLPSEIQSVFTAGEDDDFDPGADLPPATPGSALGPGLPPFEGFDKPDTPLKIFLHTFAGLPDNIVDARLEIRIRAGSEPNSINDSISLTFWEGPTDFDYPFGRYIGTYPPNPAIVGVLPNPWNLNNYPDGHILMLDLGNLPPSSNIIPGLIQSQLVNVLVWGGTEVDYLILTVCITPPPAPTPTIAPTPTEGDPDLTISKAQRGEFPFVGAGAYTLTVQNLGNGTAGSPITVLETLPYGFTFVPGSASPPWSCSVISPVVYPSTDQEVLECVYAGPLAPGDSLMLVLDVNINPIATRPPGPNCAEVRHPGDIDPSNNHSCVATVFAPAPTPTESPTATETPSATLTPVPLRGNPDLSIKKFQNTPNYYYGQSASYVFQIFNVGQGPAGSPIKVVDDLPVGFNYDSFSDPYSTDWACGVSGQRVTCTYNGPDISPGGGLPTLIINVIIDTIDRFSGGSDAAENCASVRHPGDANSANDRSCVTVIVTP